MRSLIVISHPVEGSLTHSIAGEIAAGNRKAGISAEVVNLSAEGFDPRFSPEDIKVSLSGEASSTDVRREQDRVSRADALVLVFPVYWWAMPALLKGWIDRVFLNGWAFEADAEGRVIGKLCSLDVYLVAVGGADLATYDKHGYGDAMKAQIVDGVFAYCGARRVTFELFLPGGEPNRQEHLRRAFAIGETLGQAELA